MTELSKYNFPKLLKALKYEGLRLAYNKKYLYMIILESLFAFYALINFAAEGKAGTAPYSRWTYSEFLTLVAPLLSVGLVLLCMSVFSEKEIAVRKIIFSAPVSGTEYYLLKALAVTAVFVFASSVPVLLSFAYYAHYFNFHAYGEFILPVLLFLLPSQAFVLGLAFAAGRLNSRLLYLLLPSVLFLGFFNLSFPVWFDLFGNNFLSRPLRWALGVSEGPIPYTLPEEFLYSRLILIFLGATLFVLACKGPARGQ